MRHTSTNPSDWRKVQRNDLMQKGNPTHVVCGCGGTKIKYKKGKESKGRCSICGEFGFFARLQNARFDTESLGHNSKRKGYPCG